MRNGRVDAGFVIVKGVMKGGLKVLKIIEVPFFTKL
jgi:hypothetical protein